MPARRSQGSPRFRWVFTCNNPTQNDWNYLKGLLPLCKKLICQEEKGETGTLHLQGALALTEKKRLTAMKRLAPRWHWEGMLGTWDQSVAYCSKTTFPGAKRLSHGLPTVVWVPTLLYEWQWRTVLLCDAEPHRREIHWFWETEGRKGKTELCRLLIISRDAILVGGSAKDIFNSLADWVEDRGYYPQIILWNLPRASEDHISWPAVESVKDAIFFSPKYHSRMICSNPPHLLIFANFVPDVSGSLSSDRLVVHDLNGEVCEATYPVPPRPCDTRTQMNFRWEEVMTVGSDGETRLTQQTEETDEEKSETAAATPHRSPSGTSTATSPSVTSRATRKKRLRIEDSEEEWSEDTTQDTQRLLSETQITST